MWREGALNGFWGGATWGGRGAKWGGGGAKRVSWPLGGGRQCGRRGGTKGRGGRRQKTGGGAPKGKFSICTPSPRSRVLSWGGAKMIGPTRNPLFFKASQHATATDRQFQQREGVSNYSAEN